MSWIRYQLEFKKVHVFLLLKGCTWVSGLQGRKLPNLQKILTIMNMFALKTFKDIHAFNRMA
jgi:hypothetical protein